MPCSIRDSRSSFDRVQAASKAVRGGVVTEMPSARLTMSQSGRSLLRTMRIPGSGSIRLPSAITTLTSAIRGDLRRSHTMPAVGKQTTPPVAAQAIAIRCSRLSGHDELTNTPCPTSRKRPRRLRVSTVRRPMPNSASRAIVVTPWRRASSAARALSSSAIFLSSSVVVCGGVSATHILAMPCHGRPSVVSRPPICGAGCTDVVQLAPQFGILGAADR